MSGGGDWAGGLGCAIGCAGQPGLRLRLVEQSGRGEAHLLNRSRADHLGVALAEIKDRKEHLFQLLSAFLVAIFGSDTKLLAGLRVAHCHEFLIVFKPHGTLRFEPEADWAC